ncbi:MAG: SpoIIIAH-like family protein [Clostridiaceae bacterium]|nr:SpoIIIAH-like family protein [Clostridiaceae bacterium]
MKAKTKKIIVLCSMVVLLVVTGVLNWYLATKPTGDPADPTNVNPPATETFFSAYRSDRAALRDEQYLYLDSIIASPDTSAEAKAAAEALKFKIIEEMEAEFQLERLIKAKGFSDVVVSMTANNINIVVSIDEFTDDHKMQIISTIVDETDYSPSQVKLIPYSAA